MRTFRLRQLLPAMISRAVASATRRRKLQSTIAAGQGPHSADPVTAMRPAIQAATSTARGFPWMGRRPVQFGTAVSRKPVTMAAT